MTFMHGEWPACRWPARLAVSLLAIACSPAPLLAQNEAGHEEGEPLAMSLPEQKEYGIETSAIERRTLAERLAAPGEVVVNAYASSQITPRISAQIVARHARLGDRVEDGQPLVTLTSVDMAEAQGALLLAAAEWQRVEELGRDAISGQRYTEARVMQQQAIARVLAFGMTPPEVDELLSGDGSQATGTFDLLAPQNGTIVSDRFITGEIVEPGRVLFEITDESILWVEAQLMPDDIAGISVGMPARVSTDGRDWVEAKVLQVHHELDETTRTQAVRIEVDNSDDRFHPREFVQTEIVVGRGEPVLAVPEQAIMLVDDRPTVFSRHDEAFEPVAVRIGQTAGGWTEILAGLQEDDEIVVDGAFVLKSLLLKSELGEGHGH